MNPTIESKNKALVLEAFDTLFNKRDYAAAARYWSPHYIQHSAHIELVVTACSISLRAAANLEVRTGNDRGRKRLCDRARPIFR